MTARSFPKLLTLALTAAILSPTGTAQLCKRIAYDNPTIQASLTQRAQTDCYEIQGQKGDHLRIYKWGASTILLVAEVRRPDGSQLCVANERSLVLDCTLDVTGAHRIFFRDRDLARLGRYAFTLQRLNDPVRCSSICYENQPTPGKLGAPAEVHCFTFPGKKGKRIRVNKFGVSTILLVAEIVAPDGTPLCSASERQLQFECVLPADGTYALLVRDRDLARSGGYSVQLQCLTFPCNCGAFIRSYGAGWPGSGNRVPTLTASAPPVLGTRIQVQIGNSSARPNTLALLYVGLSETEIATAFDGSLLLNPVTVLALRLPATGLTVPLDVPQDNNFCDLCVLFQTVQQDPGASKGLAFSRGFRMVFGR